MVKFLLRRLTVAILVALTVLTLSFLLTRLSGDLAISIAGPNATSQDVEIIREAYGLNRPLYVQYLDWLFRAVQGDFGDSYFFRDRVSNLIGSRLPITMTLGLVGLGLALIVALPLGIIAAVRENTWLDRTVMMVALVGQAMPSFWLGLILMVWLGLNLGLLPISGTGGPEYYVMPGIVLAFSAIPSLMRLTRSGMIEALSSDYIRTARAKGLREYQVLLGHAVKNAAIPLITQAGLELGDMVGSAFIIETVFAWPGLGRMAVNGVEQRDFLVVQGCVLVTAVGFVLINLVVDLLYAVLDPRVRAR